MTNKEKYKLFCEKTYVPIYSKPWWLNAICGEDNWNVWLYENGTDVLAAMPYYIEKRQKYSYITKAPLTQNNGIIFRYPKDVKNIAKLNFEEKVIDEACEFIAGLKIDVYEQQYHYDFCNWLPFFWNKYEAIVRYTYVFKDLSNMEDIWAGVSSNYRKKIRKGQNNGLFFEDMDYESFYLEHKKIFEKQGLECPFSLNLWRRLYNSCKENCSGKIIYSTDKNNNIASIIFLVWDEKSVYQLLGGSIPEYQNLDTYNALIWKGIEFAAERKLSYDFEGSVIKRISKSFREFGGTPMPYFRIRKIFNAEILREETERKIKVELENVI